MHILQKKAKKIKAIESPYPSNATYNFEEGVWRDQNKCLVSYDYNRALSTKKNDIETGEDQKGQ